ncbi:DUF2911 domain-containing protein [Flavobacterium algicola]|uniref:DUF2911 domain-containing protein n=1 Tax=Flavobacterium algicola TaxID=556529 RepID=UPI001EFD93BF|nr:DUF2911 domain-containing protein [Flavobacterium algicola]MCG9793430.1 DUF2911 domain-containing protein [Flavobacterium algicola]
MKNIFIALLVVFSQGLVQAQIQTPQQSPRAVINQQVGLTDIEIIYSRPSARDRIVYGNLVPFGKLWRTGANENTTISFSDDVTIDGKKLPKGKYALYTIPNIQSWDVIFYKTTDNWGTPKTFEETNVALKTNVRENATPTAVETFTIGINGIDPNGASLDMAWEHSYVSLKFAVPTQQKAIESIEKVLGGATGNDYYTAAQYYFQSTSDISKANSYMEKALALTPESPFYYLRLKSLILAKKGDRSGAIEAAKASLVASEKAGNQDYVKMNKDSIAEWSK